MLDDWLPFKDRPVLGYLSDDLPVSVLVYVLLATGFITGLLDATTYAQYGTFTSNQTGNSVLLGIGALEVVQINLIDVATSLSSFLITCVVSGQLAGMIHPHGGRTRYWAILSSSFQSLTVLLIAGLAYTDVITTGAHWSWFIILILASGAGAQVVMARQFSVQEIPTAMLTTPMADLLCDPHLFSLTIQQPCNIPRNRRLGYIFFFFAGVFLGAKIHKEIDFKAALLIAGILKALVTAVFVFIPRSKKGERRGDQHAGPVEGNRFEMITSV